MTEVGLIDPYGPFQFCSLKMKVTKMTKWKGSNVVIRKFRNTV